MLKHNHLKYIIIFAVSAVLGGCGVQEQAAPEEEATVETEDGGLRSARALKDSPEQTKLRIKSALPNLRERLGAQGIKAAACPSGVDKECLDALLLALGNSPILKKTTTKIQGAVGYLKGGSQFWKYHGVIQQPNFGVGYTLSSSSFQQGSASLQVPLTIAVGELSLYSPTPAAGVGVFGMLSDKSRVAGIVGGFAGANTKGAAVGAFGCYFLNASTPTAACVALPLAVYPW